MFAAVLPHLPEQAAGTHVVVILLLAVAVARPTERSVVAVAGSSEWAISIIVATAVWAVRN